MDTVLLTGATGFLGRAVAAAFATSGVRIRATGRNRAIGRDNREFHPADLISDDLGALVRGTDYIVHAAGLAHQFGREAARARGFADANAVATERLLRAAIAAGTSRFVLISSISVYGSPADCPIRESAECRPVGPYAESKLAAEQTARELCTASGMPLTILRLATLYGRGDPGNVARLMRTIDGGRFIWIGNGTNHKSLLHRDDAARACVLAALCRTAAPVEIYNVSATSCQMRDVVNGLAAALKVRVPRWHVPASLVSTPLRWLSALGPARRRAVAATATVEKWLRDDVVDGQRFQDAYGFRCQVGLTEGLHDEVAWYRGRASGGPTSMVHSDEQRRAARGVA